MDELIANLAFGTTQPGYRCMIISYTGAVSKFSSQNKAIYDLIRPMHDYLDDLIGIIGDLFEFRDWHNQRINSKSSTPRYLIDHTTDSDNMLSTPASYELTHAHSSRKPIVFFHTENSNIVLEKIGSFQQKFNALMIKIYGFLDSLIAKRKDNSDRLETQLNKEQRQALSDKQLMLVGSYNYSLNKITDIIRPLYNDIFNTAKQAYIVATLYDIMQTNEIYNQYTLQIVKYTENPDLAFQITEDTNIFATSLVTFVFADSNNLDIPIYSYIPNGALSNIADTQSLSIHHIMTYYKHNLYKFSNLTERTHVCYFKLKPATN